MDLRARLIRVNLPVGNRRSQGAAGAVTGGTHVVSLGFHAVLTAHAGKPASQAGPGRGGSFGTCGVTLGDVVGVMSGPAGQRGLRILARPTRGGSIRPCEPLRSSPMVDSALPSSGPAPAPASGTSPAAEAATAPHVVAPGRLFTAAWGLAVLVTVLGVGLHLGQSLLVTTPGSDPLGDRLVALPAKAWGFAGLHLLAALASLGVGYWLISIVYPRRHLGREAATNPAAAIQASAHLLGATAVAGVCWGGTDAHSLLVSAAFAGLGWAALILLCAGHRWLTHFADHEEIAAGNVAAALASAGLHLGVAVVVARAIQGQFTGWHDALTGFALACGWALALWPLRQLVIARLVLGMSPTAMDAAIATRQDPWIGTVEALGYVLSALVLSAAA